MYYKIAELFKDDSLSEDEKYKRWKELKKEEEREKTHGAERVDDRIYTLYFAIRDVCNGDKKGADAFPTLVNLYYMSDWHLEHCPDALGVYGYGVIMVRKSYYDERGIYDDDVIDNMFHEMIHAYCNMKVPEKRIHDTDGEFHRREFADVCERFGGVCRYSNATDGYNDARLPDELKRRVRDEIKRRTKDNDNG